MTREEAIICKVFLEDECKDKRCNEYKLLMDLVEAQPCEDAVSREAALKEMERYHDDCAQTSEYTRLGFETAMEVVKSLPPVTPKQRTGKWIQHGLGYRCSECAIETSEWNVKSGNMKYCPRCGAKMEGESE